MSEAQHPDLQTALRTEAEYEAALTRAETLMDADPGSPEEEELMALALVIDEYEQVHWSFEE